MSARKVRRRVVAVGDLRYVTLRCECFGFKYINESAFWKERKAERAARIREIRSSYLRASNKAATVPRSIASFFLRESLPKMSVNLTNRRRSMFFMRLFNDKRDDEFNDRQKRETEDVFMAALVLFFFVFWFNLFFLDLSSFPD